MSNRYIYGQQQVYDQNIQYTTDINTTDQIQMEGAQFGTYDTTTTTTTTYQQLPNTTVTTMDPITYQQQYVQYDQQIEQQPIYIDQGQYSEQVYLQGDQIGQVINYQTGNATTGYEQQLYPNQIKQQQQPNQKIQYQYYQQQQVQQPQKQPQSIPNQNTINSQRQAKMVRQMIQQQKTNIPQNAPIISIAPKGSRNPNISRQQYQQKQNQNAQIMNQGNVNPSPNKIEGGGFAGLQLGQTLKETKYVTVNQNQNLEQNPQNEMPQIESDFQPNIPLANSIINQSQLPFQQNQSNVANNINPQMKMPKVTPLPQKSQNIQNFQNYQQQYVVPRRNPNLNLQKYQYSNNDSHFITTADPGISTMAMNNNTNFGQNIKPVEANINTTQRNIEYTNGLFNQNSEYDDIKPEVGAGKGVFDDEEASNIGKSGIQNLENSNNNMKSGIQNMENSNNIEKSGIQNSEISNMDNDMAVSGVQDIGDSKMENVEQDLNEKFIEKKLSNEENEKENPIEEKSPDQSNIDDLGKENNQIINENPVESEIIDIDDQLDYLPTAIMVMKGKGELLPPPKKKKYQ
jgi:hypothetical protein